MPAVPLPLPPMLAGTGTRIPTGCVYEPKWDGWRALLAREGDRVRLFSRHGTELTAFFGELVAAAADLDHDCVLDGEIVIIVDGRLDYTKLASRHTTAQEASRSARRWPATMICFDLLSLDEHSLLEQPWQVRRELLESVVDAQRGPLLLSPVTTDESLAQDWFDHFEGAGLDGILAKSPTGRYLPGQRGWTKIKHRRTADVVVAGFRLDRTSTPDHPRLGSLLLGLFDDHDRLHFVGVCSGFPASSRIELAETFTSLEIPSGSDDFRNHPWGPGDSTRTRVRVPDHVTGSRHPHEQVHLIWPPVVAEVFFDQLHEQTRFRSNAAFCRWRVDKDPLECRFDQLEAPQSFELASVLAGERP